MRVLVLTELFPQPARPELGVFIERQVTHLRPYCQQVVVVPIRVFPHGRVLKQMWHPLRFRRAWQAWYGRIRQIPETDTIAEVAVHYPRYTSLPKPGFHTLMGFFATPFVLGTIRRCLAEQDVDVIHAHYASPCGVIALLTKRWHGKPVVLSIHGSDVYYAARQHKLGARIVRWVFEQVDVITANSQWTYDQIVELGGPPEKIRFLRYGGNPPPAATFTSPLPATAEGVLTLLSVAHLRQLKGHETVLRALAALIKKGYQLRYIIVGDGPEMGALQALTTELGLTEHVIFVGAKPHDEVWPYFAACDIFVLPSWVEGFGIVFLEALSLGKAVIGSQGTGGPEDLRQLGDCIELVPPRDPVQLQQTLATLIDDPERRQRMGQLGQQIVQQHFTWVANAKAAYAIYEQVCAS